jgi:hypothetical protein
MKVSRAQYRTKGKQINIYFASCTNCIIIVIMSTNGEIPIALTETFERVAENCVLIAGAGPVGLLLSVVLASYGVRSILLERNTTTTRQEKIPQKRAHQNSYHNHMLTI